MKHLRTYIIMLVVIAVSAMTAMPACAQTRKVMNRPYIDQRRIHYGFMAGIHMQDMEIQNNGYIDENGNQWFTDIGTYDPGFSVGILGELYLTKHLALRSKAIGVAMVRSIVVLLTQSVEQLLYLLLRLYGVGVG